jgi:hypothetical protein
VLLTDSIARTLGVLETIGESFSHAVVDEVVFGCQ